jgi:CheY-like chemotaxis protein
MGGEFHVESKVGLGTRFSFTIQTRRASERPSDFPGHAAVTLSGKRMLIISKDQANRRQLSRDAKAAGITAYVAGGATDAIYWLQKSDPFDVLLLDTAILARNAHLIGQLHNKSEGVPILLLKSKDSPTLTPQQQKQISRSIRLPLTTSAFYDALHNLFAQVPQAAPLQAAEASMAEQMPLQILLVEDNRINQKVAQNLLKKLGYTIEIVENGQLALDRLEQLTFDVILMDIQMPVMDGVEATKRIRNDFPPEAQPYIIAVTAHALEGDREHYLAAGMDDYISKPIKTEKLVGALHQAIRRDRNLAPTTPPLTAVSAVTKSDLPVAPPAIDYEELEMLLGEPPEDFLAEMGPEFIIDTKMLLQTLHKAVQSGNTDQIRRTAHTLKGTSASLGMPVLSARSKELELIAKSGALAQAPGKLSEIEHAFADIQSLLLVAEAEVKYE